MPQIQFLNVPRRASSCVSRRSKLGDLVFSQALHTFEQNVLKTTGSTVQDLLAAPSKVLSLPAFTTAKVQMLTRSARKAPQAVHLRDVRRWLCRQAQPQGTHCTCRTSTIAQILTLRAYKSIHADATRLTAFSQPPWVCSGLPRSCARRRSASCGSEACGR
jgi:hypothetical protein